MSAMNVGHAPAARLRLLNDAHGWQVLHSFHEAEARLVGLAAAAPRLRMHLSHLYSQVREVTWHKLHAGQHANASKSICERPPWRQDAAG